MKILLALHPILDPGGIVNHVHHLAKGLEEIGHEVEVALFQWTTTSKKVEYTLDQKKLPYHYVFGYKKDIQPALDYITGFDLVIWEVPVPTKMKANEGNNKWPELYKHGVPQIGVIHDAHIVKRTPWITHVAKYFDAIAPVNPCKQDICAKELDIPSLLIINPFDLSEMNKVPYENREKAFLSACNFKAMKHMDDLIRAIPYMPKDVKKYVGGGGIEQCYMSSEDKCKPQYMINGTRIWDRAIDFGMEYLGFLQTSDRIAYSDKVRVVVDPSYVSFYKDRGGAYTRVFVEALICGCIPVVREEMMDTTLFHPNVNFFMVPAGSTDRQFADIVTYACNVSEDQYKTMTINSYTKLNFLDRKTVAQEFIHLYTKAKVMAPSGRVSDETHMKSRAALKDFFGISTKPATTGVNKWLK